MRPEFRIADAVAPADKERESLCEQSFTTANLVPDQGVLRGSSALVQLGDASPNRAVLRADVFQHATFDAGASPDGSAYPRSLMGVIAALRQTFFDAQHYAALADANPPRRDAFLGYNQSLEALRPAMAKKQPVVFEPGSALMVDRAARLGVAGALSWRCCGRPRVVNTCSRRALAG